MQYRYGLCSFQSRTEVEKKVMIRCNNPTYENFEYCKSCMEKPNFRDDLFVEFLRLVQFEGKSTFIEPTSEMFKVAVKRQDRWKMLEKDSGFVEVNFIDNKFRFPLYEDVKHNILLQLLRDKIVVFGSLREVNYDLYDLDIKEFPLLPLNSEEIQFCKKNDFVIDDFLMKGFKDNFQARKIQKVWKKYWYEYRDENGENRFIKSLKKRIPYIL